MSFFFKTDHIYLKFPFRLVKKAEKVNIGKKLNLVKLSLNFLNLV